MTAPNVENHLFKFTFARQPEWRMGLFFSTATKNLSYT